MEPESEIESFGTKIGGGEALVSKWAQSADASKKPARSIPTGPSHSNANNAPSAPRWEDKLRTEEHNVPTQSQKLPSKWASAAADQANIPKGPRATHVIPPSKKASTGSRRYSHNKGGRPAFNHHEESHEMDQRNKHESRGRRNSHSRNDHGRNRHENQSNTRHESSKHEALGRSHGITRHDYRQRNQHSVSSTNSKPPAHPRRARPTENNAVPEPAKKANDLSTLSSWEDILKTHGSWAEAEEDFFPLKNS